jgi:hypothetical protein
MAATKVKNYPLICDKYKTCHRFNTTKLNILKTSGCLSELIPILDWYYLKKLCKNKNIKYTILTDLQLLMITSIYDK